MIAPLRQTPAPQGREPEALRAARRAVAAALLRRPSDESLPGPPIPAWQAWSLTAWAALVAGYWLYAMWAGWQ